MSVDFPEPFSPRSPCTSPRRTARLTPFRARLAPKLFEIRLASMTCGGACIIRQHPRTPDVRLRDAPKLLEAVPEGLGEGGSEPCFLGSIDIDRPDVRAVEDSQPDVLA